MSKYHAVSSGMVTRSALPSITRQRGTTTGSANLMLYGAGKTTVSNNTTFVDSSANAFTITNNGSTAQAGYNPFSQASAGAGTFNGSTDYLTAPASANFSLTGDFTVEGWVWIDSTITSTSPDGNKSVALFSGFGASSGTATFSINGSTTVAGTGFGIYQDSPSVAFNQAVSVPLNAWNHVAFTRTGTTVYAFLNGTRYTLGTSSATIISSASPVAVGRNQNTPYYAYCKGYISNVRVVKGTAVYTSNFTPPTSPLTAITNTSLLLLMDNYSIVNSTSTNLPVTINTGASISTAQFPTGMSSSMLFNGTTGYVTIPNGGNFQFGTGDFTIEWWQYQTGSIPYPRVFSIGTYPTAFGVSIESGSIYYWTNTSSAAIRTASGIPNNWVHIAVARSSNITKIFLNGVQLGANISDSANISNSSTALSIAAETIPSANTYFSGYISNFRSVKGAALYTANFTVPSAPLPLSVTVPNFVTNNIYGMNQIP